MSSSMDPKTLGEVPSDYVTLENDTPQHLVASNVFEDRRGMRLTSGRVTLTKDDQNLVGVSIGGGAPLCPCVYVVQIFDNTPAAKDGTLASGDEIVAINGISVKGYSKTAVSQLIQSNRKDVVITYNKLHTDPNQLGSSLDIVLKNIKHRFVESVGSATADTLGLSRAILVNDSLVKKLQEMEDTAALFTELTKCVRHIMASIYDLAKVQKEFGAVLGLVACKEPQINASKAFATFSASHLSIEKYALECLNSLKPMLSDVTSFTKIVVPDMKLTINKYLDAKFLYLSYCLKVKEMDDEEFTYASVQEPLYRVETGNYEYRMILRGRQEARKRFAKVRNDVYEKLELLDNKHVQDIVRQFQRFVNSLNTYYSECYTSLKNARIFPIELQLNYQPETSTGEDVTSVDENVMENMQCCESEVGELIEMETRPSTSGNIESEESKKENDDDILLDL